jgi:hypothetical protein
MPDRLNVLLVLNSQSFKRNFFCMAANSADGGGYGNACCLSCNHQVAGVTLMRYVVLAIALLMGTQSVCRADEQFRCGQWVVSQAISVAELLKKCGEPTSKTASTTDVRVRTSKGYVVPNGMITTEIWTYDRGSRAFAMIVTIVDGRIESMTRGE